jgi:adenylate cyclase
VICASCGTENRPDRKFCLRCGSPLAAACPNCGAANEREAAFCGECGQALSGPSGPVASPAAAASGAGQATGRPATERRLVSILFADLVGFTTLTDGRDPEETRC